MAKAKNSALLHVKVVKKTNQDKTSPKTSSMNKSKRRSFKKYRGQGRP
jgi:hypothetical protein